jgi:hypothetical protein
MRHVPEAMQAMTIVAKKADVLERLHKNREKHTQIVKEARVGYVEKATEKLKEKLALLSDGKIVQLDFSLRVPLDYTNSYDLAIEMMEWHQDDSIRLTGEQVRNLLRDEWDWTQQFYLSNSRYSSTAAVAASAYPSDD